MQPIELFWQAEVRISFSGSDFSFDIYRFHFQVTQKSISCTTSKGKNLNMSTIGSIPFTLVIDTVSLFSVNFTIDFWWNRSNRQLLTWDEMDRNWNGMTFEREEEKGRKAHRIDDITTTTKSWNRYWLLHFYGILWWQDFVVSWNGKVKRSRCFCIERKSFIYLG